MIQFEQSFFTQKTLTRILVGAVVFLALLAGLGWEQYKTLGKKYDVLEKKHERLNKIYLQGRQK